jgi:hypothetical protein
MKKKRKQTGKDDEASDDNAASKQAQFQALIAEIWELQERILRKRGGQPVEVDALLEQLREERDDENLRNCGLLN